MEQFISTALFWIALALISAWVLPRFYFSNNPGLILRLRITACILNLLALGLFYFDWIPPQPRGLLTGFGLILMGNISMAYLFFIIFVPTLLFLIGFPKLLKIGAVLEIIATISLFKVMSGLLPGATPLLLKTSAPIFVAFLLLINSVVVLLLWHQLQKKYKKI